MAVLVSLLALGLYHSDFLLDLQVVDVIGKDACERVFGWCVLGSLQI
jgi:hypothetical protein